MSRIAKALRDLAAGRPAMDLPPDLRSIPSQMENVAGGRTKYRRAAGMIRSQRGLRNRFEEAIEISGMFMPGIQRTLAEYGLPAEIRCLPFVESMFNYRARSKVGASGAWQGSPPRPAGPFCRWTRPSTPGPTFCSRPKALPASSARTTSPWKSGRWP